MRYALSVLVAALAVSLAPAQPPSAADYYSKQNPPPKDPDVAALKARVSALEQMVAETDAKVTADSKKLDAILAAVAGRRTETPTPAVVAAAPVPVRAPTGHTHTDSKGHTWDHAADGGSHRCPLCGEFQNVVDQPSRMVNAGPGAAAFSQSGVSSYSYSLTTSGGCANGSCAAPTSARRGLFGWRR